MNTPENRRLSTIKTLQSMGIDHCQTLPLIDNMVMTKDLAEICRRAVISLYISVMSDYFLNDKEEYDNGEKQLLMGRLKVFDALSAAFPVEKSLIDDKISENDALQLTWGIECSYMLLWVLGFVETSDAADACDECDPRSVIRVINSFDNLKEMMDYSHLRPTGEILNMLDLYYNYHWACVDHSVNPDTNCGDLNKGVVRERRKALEWLFDKTTDWSEISLDT